MSDNICNNLYVCRFTNRTRHYVLISNELLFSTIAMLWIINLFTAESLQLFGLSAPTMLVYMVIYFFALLGWIRAFTKKTTFTILTLIILIFVFTISVLVNDDIVGVMFNFQSVTLTNIGQSNFAKLTGLCLPLLLLSQITINYKKLICYIYRYSVISVILFIITMFFQIFIFPRSINYMTLAYAAVGPIICLIMYGKTYERKFPLFLSVLGTIFILLGGCRGALLTISIFVLLIFLRIVSEKKGMMKLLLLLLISILIIILILNLNNMIRFFADFLRQYGYSSRLIEKFLGSSTDGDLFQFADRSQIYERLIPNIDFFGHGIYGDWVLNNGVYSHNFFVEILVQYGILFGAIILICFGYYLIRTMHLIIKGSDTFMRYMVYAFVSILVGKMMFSSSYLIDSSFWLFLSMISLIHNKYRIKGNDEYEGNVQKNV